MNRPLRENLELTDEKGKTWVQCGSCGHRLAPADEDWKTVCLTRLLPPTHMGPHHKIMTGHLVLREHYCPGCGLTLDADVVKDENASA
jgi:acetone carboxylase gamma subunit